MAKSYHYEPAQTVLTGVLARETGETPEGKKVLFPAIRMPWTITVQGDEELPIEKGVVMLHAILGKSSTTAAFKSLLGKRVGITDKPMRSETGHHPTNALITAEQIDPAK